LLFVPINSSSQRKDLPFSSPTKYKRFYKERERNYKKVEHIVVNVENYELKHIIKEIYKKFLNFNRNIKK